MSGHEADATGQDAESHANGSFSNNGYEPSGGALATDDRSSTSGNDGSSFLAELARAMQTAAAAEQARDAEGTETRRQTHVDAIRAREALEAEELRELAKEDVKGIDAWSDGEIKRIKLERERRIAARREQLQIRLEEHRTVVGREVEAVEAAIVVYKSEIEHYFRRLDAETDPVAIAQFARSRPPFPVLELIGPNDAPGTTDHRQVVAETPHVSHAKMQTEATAEAETPADDAIEQGSGQDTDDSAFPPITGNELIGVMEPVVAAESTDETAVATDDAGDANDADPNDGTGAPEDADASQEPVGAVAGSRVVMPRSTGAGSWLRWPNSSADHSDSGH